MYQFLLQLVIILITHIIFIEFFSFRTITVYIKDIKLNVFCLFF